MPLYEYECEKCGERFEKLVAADSRSNGGDCPKCGSEETGRVPSTFAVGKPSVAGPTCCPGGTCGP